MNLTSEFNDSKFNDSKLNDSEFNEAFNFPENYIPTSIFIFFIGGRFIIIYRFPNKIVG